MRPPHWSTCAATVSAIAAALPAQGDAARVLDRVPADALGFLFAPAPAAAVAALEAAIGAVPAAMPVAAKGTIAAGLVVLRAALGGSVEDTAALVGGGGLVVALLPGESRPRVVAVARPPDVAAAQRWCDRHGERVHAARDGDLLLLGDSPAALAALRRDVPPGERSRWAAMRFDSTSASTVAYGAFDLARVRALAPAPRHLGGAPEFVALPVLAAAADATMVRVRVDAAADLAVELTADASVLSGNRASLMARGAAPRTIVPLADDGLALVTLDRSLRTLFAGAERFLAPGDRAAVQGFLSIADALDGPRSSFVDDLLGGLDEPFVLHVTPPADGDDGEPRSPVRPPEFALVAGMHDAKVAGVVLRVAEVFATIANAERAQRGQGLFHVRRVTDDSGIGLVAEPPDWRGPGSPPVDRQLSPTVWCGRGLVVLASTERAARGIVERAGTGVAVHGDVIELRGPAIASLLAANRAPLELARRLDEGDEPGSAQQFFGVVEAVVGALRHVRFACEVDASTTRLRLVAERRP